MKCGSMLLVWGLLAMVKSAALESGFYLKGDKFEELNKVIESADREIECSGIDEFSIGIRREGGEVTFSLWELDKFLQEEKHKDCLVLDMGKGVVPYEEDEKEERKQFIDKLVGAFSKYGYRRILIIAWTGGGALELIADVTVPAPKPAAPK